LNFSSDIIQPDQISFCPLNWRILAVAYKNEINIWNMEQCDTKLFKSYKSRLILPPISDQQLIEQHEITSEFKDEFNYPLDSITNLENELAVAIEDILDKQERHVFKAMCWTNNKDEIIFVSKLNYIFKVNNLSLLLKNIIKFNLKFFIH
jgi:hypothetical protein